jgi:hypothetical protein
MAVRYAPFASAYLRNLALPSQDSKTKSCCLLDWLALMSEQPKVSGGMPERIREPGAFMIGVLARQVPFNSTLQ